MKNVMMVTQLLVMVVVQNKKLKKVMTVKEKLVKNHLVNLSLEMESKHLMKSVMMEISKVMMDVVQQ